MDDDVKLALDHAWRYFQMHAQQRINVFNYFVASSSLLVTGLGIALHSPRDTWYLGVVAGMLLILISFIFWNLDARVSSLIKVSEEIISRAEERLITDPELRTVSVERTLTRMTKFSLFNTWTYGQAFRRIFAIMALIGLGGSVLSLLRAYEQVDDKKAAIVATPVSISSSTVIVH